MPRPSVPLETWARKIEAFYKYMDDFFRDSRRYSRWASGDFSEVARSIVGDETVEGAQVSAVNMTALVMRSRSAHLFFNAPKVVVKPEVGFETEDLADVETVLLNDAIRTTNFYRNGKKSIGVDGFLWPYFVMKVGYSADIGTDLELLESERRRAEDVALQIQAGEVFDAQKDDVHYVHVSNLSNMLEAVNLGDLQLPEEVVDNIQEKIRQHQEFQKDLGEQDTETVRGERVYVRRKKPDHVFFDVWAQDMQSLRWVGECILATVQDIKRDRRYKVTKDTLPLKDEEEGRVNNSDRLSEFLGVDYEKEFDDGEPRVLIYEVVDLDNNEVVTFAEGAKRPLRVVDYEDKDIRPNGPYEFEHYEDHPDEIFGIPQPSYWEDQQMDVALMNTVETIVGKMNVPGMVYNADFIDEDEARNMSRSIIGRLIKAKNLDEGRRVQDVYGEIPLPKITPEMQLIKRFAMEVIERTSLLGSARTGGGERAQTATAAAIVSESVGAFTQDAAVMVDHYVRRIVCAMLRLIRKYYSLPTVRNVAGDKGLEVWREFSAEEVKDDRGVEIVVGTMRRESTDVELKLMNDLYATIVRNPVFAASPALQMISVRLLDHMMKLYGAPVSLSDIEKQIADNPQAFTGPAGPGEERGGGQDGSAALNDLAQGVQNVGGGRLPGGGA